jgi:hypothetical protein
MDEQPSPWSADFHLRFLPGVVRRRLGPAPAGSGFASHGSLVSGLGFAVSTVVLLFALPGAIGASPDWLSRALALLAAAALVALVVLGIRAQRGVAVSYDAFSVGIFTFCIVLGGTAGLWSVLFGAEDRIAAAQSAGAHGLINLAAVLGGLVAGYAVGVPAGLWAQRLGPLGSLLGALAWPAVIGMIATNLVLLSA